MTPALALVRAQADGFVTRRLAGALLLVFATAALAALAPVALKFAIDALTSGQPKAISLPLLPGAGAAAITFNPVALIALYLGCLWASRSFGELRWYIYGTADRRLQRGLSRTLLDHIIRLPMSFHLDRSTGGLNQTLVQGLSGYSLILNHMIFTVLPVIVEVALIAFVLSVFFSGAFLVILGVSVVAYAAAFAIGVRQIIGPIRAASASQIDAYANLTDSLLNSETVKYFGAEAMIGERYDSALKASEAHWKRFYWVKSANGLLVAIVFAGSLGAALLLAAQQVSAGRMTVGDFVLVNAYMLQIVKPMETLGGAFRDLTYGFAFIEKMTALMARAPEYAGASAVECSRGSHATSDTPPIGAGELSFDAVHFAYLPERPVLHDISFTAHAGKTVGIVGGSGAGKSSMIRLLMRLYELDSGEIRLNGVPSHRLRLADLRSAIAIVPQDTVLFNDTIAYNIGFGRQGATQAEIEAAARFAQIHDTILAMPHGYATKVGERGLKLSGGEKQRVSIARAALKRPQLFVFDEATSSLDSKTERGILDNLIAVSKGMTTLIIAHRLSTVLHADEILVLSQGRIAERGSHDALLAQHGIYASMWRTQQRGGQANKHYAFKG
jgi:ABC-type transport system involved in Fe-S cluster assembly fused permease/ATPase subunit